MRVFVTGASGWIGSAVVPELVGAGHQVTGLARSDASAAALTAAGAGVQRGTIDDLGVLRSAAAASAGVIHLAFKHDIAFSGDFQGAADADRRAIETFGEALAGSGKPFVIASGTLGLAPGRVATERDGLAGDPATALTGGPAGRHLGIPVVAIAPEDAAGHFTWLGGFLGADSPASSELTRALMGWQPTHPGLIEDLEKGHYFESPPA
jgi:NAD(P)H-binding